MKVEQTETIVRNVVVENEFSGLSLDILKSFNIPQKVKTPVLVSSDSRGVHLSILLKVPFVLALVCNDRKC